MTGERFSGLKVPFRLTYFTFLQQLDAEGMQAVAVVRKLKKGDQILVSNEYGNLRDSSSEMFTQFIGILLDSSDVIFNAERTTNVNTIGTITYSSVDVNHGNGMSASEGIFTAPVTGTYYFHFQGVSDHNSRKDLYLNFYHDGTLVSSSYKRFVSSTFNI